MNTFVLWNKYSLVYHYDSLEGKATKCLQNDINLEVKIENWPCLFLINIQTMTFTVLCNQKSMKMQQYYRHVQ